MFAHKGSGSHVHVCPRPCSSTCRWARHPTHRHKGTTLSVQSVLSCPLWPCAHRMCVIAKETGLSPLAGTCSRTWAFLRRLHIQAHRFLLTHAVHVRRPRYKKSAIVSPETWLSFVGVTTRVFRPARRLLHSGVTKIITIHKVFFHVITVRDLP